MKQPTKPTRKQKILISDHGLNCANWLVVSDTPESLCIINRSTDRKRYLKKEGLEK